MALASLMFGGGGGASFPLGNAESMGYADVSVIRGAAGRLEQRGPAASQIYRIGSGDAVNGEWVEIVKALNGTATVQTGAVGTGAARDLVLTRPGGAMLTFPGYGSILCSGEFYATRFALGQASTNPAFLTGSIAGTVRWDTFVGGNFVGFQWGGTSNAFPYLKRNGVGVDFLRADDTAGGFVRVVPVAFANLPNAATAGAGARAFITDSNTNTYNAAAAGGGAFNVPVFSDGSAWKVG